MTRCLAIACLLAAVVGAATPVPAHDPLAHSVLIAGAASPGDQPPADPGSDDPPPPPPPPPATGGPETENHSGMTCC